MSTVPYSVMPNQVRLSSVLAAAYAAFADPARAVSAPAYARYRFTYVLPQLRLHRISCHTGTAPGLPSKSPFAAREFAVTQSAHRRMRDIAQYTSEWPVPRGLAAGFGHSPQVRHPPR